MVAIGRALMANPRLLILDEPSLGLQPSIVSEVFEKLAQLKATVSILVTEQNVRESLRAVDRGYVLENGAVALEDSAAGLSNNPHVIRLIPGDLRHAPSRPEQHRFAVRDRGRRRRFLEGHMTAKTITVGETRIHYVEHGRGIDVVFVHGNIGSSRWFGRVMDVPGCRTVALDMPNFGRSSALPGRTRH